MFVQFVQECGLSAHSSCILESDLLLLSVSIAPFFLIFGQIGIIDLRTPHFIFQRMAILTTPLSNHVAQIDPKLKASQKCLAFVCRHSCDWREFKSIFPKSNTWRDYALHWKVFCIFCEPGSIGNGCEYWSLLFVCVSANITYQMLVRVSTSFFSLFPLQSKEIPIF